MAVTPWWDAIELRDEILDASGRVEDVQMSLFNAVHGVGGDPSAKAVYADPDYYGRITHPTSELIGFMGQIAVRLGGSPEVYTRGKSVWRLDQAMGGGKSHGLIGLWHLAVHTGQLAQTDLGRLVFKDARALAEGGTVADDLANPRCVVLSCDNMTPGQPDKSLDGPASTLWERFLWRLLDADHKEWDERRKKYDKDAVARALRSVDRPVLVLIDEIMDWIQKATAPTSGYEGIVEDMGFLRSLLDAANDVPNVAVVVVMIASDKDNITLSEEGETKRLDLDDLLTRNGYPQAVTSGGDFAEILRRRLFDDSPGADVIGTTAAGFLADMTGPWAKEVFDRLGGVSGADFQKDLQRCYPFHPSLIDLAEREWSQHAGFQKVRSTIQIFAATVYQQAQRAKAGEWAPALIGPGDLPLSSGDVREALLGSGIIADQRTVAGLREIAATEIVNPDDTRGTMRQLDLARDPSSGYLSVNPRVAERMGTALFVYSLAPREQGRQGATEHELKAAAFVPSKAFGAGDADLVLTQLRSPDEGLAALEELPGKGGQPARLMLSTRQTLNMFVKSLKNAITDEERDEALAQTALDLARTGPFKEKLFVRALAEADDPRTLRQILEDAGVDDARSNRLVILDPRRFSLLNGLDAETRDALRAAMGLGDNKLPVGWASSAVFACVNTQRRANARGLATEYLARQRTLELNAVRDDEDLYREAKEKAREARERFERAVRNAFQHVVYLGEDAAGTRIERTYRFDKENHSALDGALVWPALVDADKAYGEGEFDAKALMHQLRDMDFGKPLSEIRDGFWNSPRLPLLPKGEEDLRRAIYSAVQNGDVRLVDGHGQEVHALMPAEINLGSASVRLEKPVTGEPVTVPDVVGKSVVAARLVLDGLGLHGDASGDGVVSSQDPSAGETADPGSTVKLDIRQEKPPSAEHQVVLAKMTSLDDQGVRDSIRTLLMAVQNAVGDGDASYLSLNLQIVVPTSVKENLVAKADAAGIPPKVTDL